MAVQLDDIDLRLLSALQEEADRTNVDLARLVGLSPAATLHRIRRLKESGAVRAVTARLDPNLLGLPLQAYVLVTMARHGPRAERAFEEEVRALPQVISADYIAGETDVIVFVVAREVSELQHVLSRLAVRGGSRLVTLLRLAEIKPPAPLPLLATTRGRR